MVACASACARGECGEVAGAAAAHAQLTVATLRNASGHWEARVRLYQEAAPPARLQPLLVDVRPASSLCGPLRSHLLTVTLSGPPLVPPGYTELSGLGFYRLYEENITWPEAKSACEAEGAHLLVLNSQAEATAIQKLIQRHPSVTPWIHIGFHDKIKEGHYVTIFDISFILERIKILKRRQLQQREDIFELFKNIFYHEKSGERMEGTIS
ncbi:Hemolymph lipopolysaccharide-binding protein [Gryllus bimaculatus]|nr:Hemolymph lipopolysaccharide-binding protein [Gryllus bimaculatus]